MRKINYFKLGGIFILLLILSLGVLIINLDISNQLKTNLQKNLSRSFKDSGMETRLEDLKTAIFPLSIRWSNFKIDRIHPSDIPNSWIHIFQRIELSGCRMGISPYWFKLRLDLNCLEIDLEYIPLKWFFVPDLSIKYSSNFFFTNADFKNLESKHGWFKTTISADNFFLNGKNFGPLNLGYYFKSPSELLISKNNSKEKIIFNSIPGQLEIFDQGSRKKFGFLNKSLYLEIIRIL